MNWLDLLIVIPLIWGAYQGYKKGLVYMVLMLIGIVLGLYVAFKFSGLAVGFLAEHIKASKNALPYVAFFMVFAGIVLLIVLLAKFLEAVLKAASLSTFNKIAGGLLGIAKWGLIVSVFLGLLRSLENQVRIIPITTEKESKLYKPVLMFSAFLSPAFAEIKREFNENLGKIDSVIINTGKDTSHTTAKQSNEGNIPEIK